MVTGLALSLLVALPGFRQDLSEQVEALRSDRIEEREEAARSLRRAGREVVPLLEKAQRDPDPEMAARAGSILRLHRVLEGLTPRFRQAFPDSQQRLVTGGDSAFTDLFLEAVGRGSTKFLGRSDLRTLVGPSFLGAETPLAKSRLCQEAARFDLHEVVPAIERLLEDESPEVRLEAVGALSFLHSGGSEECLVRALEDPSLGVRCRAARALADLELARTVPKIKALLHDPEYPARFSAAHALLELRCPEALGIARTFAEDQNLRTINLGAWMLEVLSPREAVAPLAKLARTSVAWDFLICKRLARLGAEAELRGLLSEGDPDIRLGTIRALGQSTLKGLIPDLRKRVGDPVLDVQREAIRALGALRVREAIPELLPLVDSPDENLRNAAVSTLAELGARELVPKLRCWLDLEHPEEYRWAAANALRKLGATEAAPDLRALLGDPDPDVRELGIRVLADLGDHGAVPELLDLLKEPYWINSAQAILALGHLGAREAAPRIAGFLQSGPPERVQAAIWALCRLGAREQAPQVFELLKKRGCEIRWELHGPLKRLGAGEHLGLLADLLKDPDPKTRRRGVEFLPMFPREAALPYVRPLLEDSDSWVRSNAAYILCDAGSREALEPCLSSYYLPRSLNRFRAPDLWRRLEETRVSPIPEGPPEGVAREVARRLGLRLTWEVLPPMEEEVLRCGGFWRELDLPTDEPENTILEILERQMPSEATFILDPDRIRVVSRTRADVFWHRWWDAEESRSR